MKNVFYGSVTDATSMMVKFGKLVPTEHYTCYSHGMHLVVQEVLYQNPSQKIQENKIEEACDEVVAEVDFLIDKNIPIPKVKVHLQPVIPKVRNPQSKMTSFKKKSRNSAEKRIQ